MAHSSQYRESQLALLRKGILQAIPIVLGYLPIGFAFGVLAHGAGISVFNVLWMSLLVFAGSAQFIAVGMIESISPPLTVIITTFIVNLRHFLMSASISPYLARWGKGRRALFGFQLTDETFALHSAQFFEEVPPAAQIFSANATAHLSWVLGSILGALAGGLVTNTEKIGLDYALPAMFIALLLAQLRSRYEVMVAVISGAVAAGLYWLGYQRWYVIIATLIAATIGLLVNLWMEKRYS